MKTAEMNAAPDMFAEPTEEERIELQKFHQKYPSRIVTWKDDFRYKIYKPNLTGEELSLIDNYLRSGNELTKKGIDEILMLLTNAEIADYEIANIYSYMDNYDVPSNFLNWFEVRRRDFEYIGEVAVKDGATYERQEYYGEVPEGRTKYSVPKMVDPLIGTLDRPAEEQAEYDRTIGKDDRKEAEEWYKRTLAWHLGKPEEKS